VRRITKPVDELRRKAVGHAEARGYVFDAQTQSMRRGREQVTVIAIDRIARELGFVILDLVLVIPSTVTWAGISTKVRRRPDPVA